MRHVSRHFNFHTITSSHDTQTQPLSFTAAIQVQRKCKRPKQKGRKSSYRNYTQDDLEIAIEKIMAGKISRSEAAERYNIPVKTLGYKIRAKEMDNNQGDPRTAKKPENVKHYENLRSILLCSNATPIKGHWGIGYTCCFCPQQYTDASELKYHTLTTHDDETKSAFMKQKDTYDFSVKLDVTNLQCNLCSNEIETLEELMKHLNEKHETIMHFDIPNQIIPFAFHNDDLQCIVCKTEFFSFKNLNDHMSSHYGSHECKFCGKMFVNKTCLRIHGYRHRNGEFSCRICKKTFQTLNRKSDHERVVHRLNNKYHKCGYCDETFYDGFKKSLHQHLIHGAELKTYKCKACDTVFNRQQSLTRHIKSYHLLQKPYKCNICDKAFSLKTVLSRHLKSHEKVNRFQCELCAQSFVTEYSLNKHQMKCKVQDK